MFFAPALFHYKHFLFHIFLNTANTDRLILLYLQICFRFEFYFILFILPIFHYKGLLFPLLLHSLNAKC